MTHWLETLGRETRQAVRTLLRTPLFTATVIVTLALGIGVNAAMFSAVNAVLLQPLPFPDPDRLVELAQLEQGTQDTNVAGIRLEDWNRLNSVFSAITGYYVEDVSDTTGDLPDRTRRARVAPRFLSVWAVNPALGRDFTPEEERFGGPFAVLISDRYWRTRFGADPNVLDRAIRVGSQSYDIVGVMPASFAFPDRNVDLWSPVFFDAPYGQARRNGYFPSVVARLKAGVTIDQATADFAAVQANLAQQFPATDSGIDVRIAPLKSAMLGNSPGSLWLLFGAVSVLLLITCTNIASLLLSRAVQRERFVALRFALGASRWAVSLPLMIETFVLAGVGATIGLSVAIVSINAFRVLAPDLPRFDDIRIDGTVLAYTVACAIGVAIICAAAPAIRSARSDSALARSGRGEVVPRQSLQWLLVGVQITLSVALLAAGGLLLRSFGELSNVDPGFDSNRVLTFRISGSFSEAANYGGIVERINGTLAALRELPGVDATATTAVIPGVASQGETEFASSRGVADQNSRLTAELRTVSAGYFDTMRMQLLEGEACRAQPYGTNPEMVVNRLFVTQYFAGQTVVGTQLSTVGATSGSRIVGVVGDAKEIGLDRNAVPTVYACFSAPTPIPWFLVRTTGNPNSVVADVRQRMSQLEPLRAVYDISPLETRIGDTYAANRLRTLLLVSFATAALLLSCMGVYATMSYVVGLRRREVALYAALGASRRRIVAQLLARTLKVAVSASLVGLLLAFAVGQLISGMLYGVSPSDPLTLSGVAAFVIAVSTVAAAIPSFLAAGTEPMLVLRDT